MGVWVWSLSLSEGAARHDRRGSAAPGRWRSRSGSFSFTRCMTRTWTGLVWVRSTLRSPFASSGEEEGVVHLPRRVLGREVQRREVVEVGPRCPGLRRPRSPSRRRRRSSRPSPAWWGAPLPLRRGGGRQGEVDALGGQLGVELGGLQARPCARRSGGLDAVAQAVDLRAGARVRSSGLMAPSDFSSSEMEPDLPRAETRTASRAAASARRGDGGGDIGFELGGRS